MARVPDNLYFVAPPIRRMASFETKNAQSKSLVSRGSGTAKTLWHIWAQVGMAVGQHGLALSNHKHNIGTIVIVLLFH